MQWPGIPIIDKPIWDIQIPGEICQFASKHFVTLKAGPPCACKDVLDVDRSLKSAEEGKPVRLLRILGIQIVNETLSGQKAIFVTLQTNDYLSFHCLMLVVPNMLLPNLPVVI